MSVSHQFISESLCLLIINTDKKGCDKNIFLVRMRRFFLTSDTIDILCLVFFKFLHKKKNTILSP